MEADQIFNLCEGTLWIIIAVLLALQIRRNAEYRDFLIVSSLAFFVFGFSDFVEMVTREWYTPFWLLILKGGCILTFVFTLRAFLRRKKLNETKKT